MVQFIALFGEMKKGEWPTFGSQHEYWEKAADFIQQTVGTTHKRSSKTEILLLFHFPFKASSKSFSDIRLNIIIH